MIGRLTLIQIFLIFEVERSFANEPFKQIAVVPAQVNSTTKPAYQFVDEAISAGHYIYRLKSIGPDESFSYSTATDMEVTPETQLTLVPNPASDRVLVYLIGTSDRGTLQIISMDGSILKQVLIKNSSEEPIDLNIGDLERGLLMVQFTSEGGEKTTRKLMLY